MSEAVSKHQTPNNDQPFSSPLADSSLDDFSVVNLNSVASDLEAQVAELGPTDITPVANDQVFNREELGKFDRWNIDSLKARDEVYSMILNRYQQYADTILTKNPGRQAIFFRVSMGLLILSPLQFFACLYFLRNSENIVPLIASSVEVLGALLVFPKIIAKYLFNTNETTSINNIVAAIQNYDISIRSGIRHTVENHSDQNKGQ